MVMQYKSFPSKPFFSKNRKTKTDLNVNRESPPLILFFVTCLVIATNSHGKSLIEQEALDKFSYEISASVGKKSGDYLWNIASDFYAQQTPNILSELDYSKISVLEATLDWQMEKELGSMAGLVFGISFGTGLINNGEVRDSDYDGDNRTGEFSRSRSQTKGSHTLSLSGHLGWAFYTKSRWRIMPSLGYSYSSQNFTKTNGVQVLATNFRTPPQGAFGGLNSTYNAEWYGVFTGLSVGKKTEKHVWEASAKWHIPEYYAEADWNLRSDFSHPKSFAHWSDGEATVFKVSYAYRTSETFAIGVKYQIESWKSDAGIDTVYFNDGDTASTQLNEASWDASSLAVSLNWQM